MASTHDIELTVLATWQTLSFGIIISLCAWWLYNLAYATDVPKIRGIPELPNAIPFYGHLKALGDDHPTAFEEYSTKNKHEVVQAKLGNRRILVLNSYKAAQEFMVKNASATIDRPLFYTFHGIVSKTQGGTIGTAPWNESTKRMRTVAGALMTRPAIQRSAPMLDIETTALVKSIFEHSRNASVEVDPRIFFQRQALNLTLMWCYGTRIASVEDPLLHKILRVAHSVSSFRSTNNNIQDYVPFYRYLPTSERNKTASNDRDIRDVWLNELFQKVIDNVRAGRKPNCISAGLLSDSSDDKLTEAEIKSINVSFVSGGFETLATSGIACVGWLSTEEGQKAQERAYQDIIANHGSVDTAWDECVLEEKSPYVVALVREGLRYYVPIPFLTPRQTMKPFNWRGVEIPKGLTVHINGQSVNHDPECYGPDAHIFRPERWLEDEIHEVKPPGPPYQYSYGAGSRMCPAVAISNRLLYATYVRLIIHFRIKASKSAPPNVDYIQFNEDLSVQTAIPKRFNIELERRESSVSLMQCIARSEKATSGLYD